MPEQTNTPPVLRTIVHERRAIRMQVGELKVELTPDQAEKLAIQLKYAVSKLAAAEFVEAV